MRDKDARFLLLLALAAAALLAPALLRPGAFLGNFGDVYAYHYPLKALSVSALQSGSMPFWNPYIFAGLPHLANSQAALFYPLSILFYHLPLGYAFTLNAFLHLFLAALGMYLLMRSAALGAAASAILSLAFCLSPFLVYRIPQGIPTHLASLAFVPWCWLALRSGRPGFLGAVWSLQLLSGHPQYALVNAAGMAVYAALRPRVRGTVFLREGLVAAALTAVQWLLTAQFIGRSNRVGLPEAFANAYSMPLSALKTLLAPGAAGDPLSGSFSSFPSVFFESYACYIGLLPLALAVYALFRPPRAAEGAGLPPAWACWLIAVLGIFLAMGRFNPFADRLAGLPVIGLSRTPARFSLLAVWGLLLAAGAGWLRLRRDVRIGNGWKLAALLFVVADLGLWSSRFVYAEDAEPKLGANPVMAGTLGGRSVRFASGPEVANPNKAMLYHAMNVNGYEAYYLDSYARYAAASEAPRRALTPSRAFIRSVESPQMRSLGVGWLLTSERRQGSSIEVSDEYRIYRVPGAMPLVRVETGARAFPAAALMEPTGGRWDVRGRIPGTVSGDARLVFSVPAYPGWRAWLNGRRVRLLGHQGLLQAVGLDGLGPGESFSAVLLFRPTAWTALALLTALSWMLWFAFAPRRLFA